MAIWISRTNKGYSGIPHCPAALSEYKVMLSGALNAGVTPIEVKEIVYQSVPYVGIAKVLDFIHATNEILESRGIKLPLEGQSTTSPETRYEKDWHYKRRFSVR